MEKFTNKVKLIKEGKTIFYLCDEFDAEMEKIDKQKKIVSDKYKGDLLRMTILILESYIQVHNTQVINLKDYYNGKTGDGEDEDDYEEYEAVYVGNIHIDTIQHKGGNEWRILGYGYDDISNREVEMSNDLNYLEADELSSLLRGILEIRPIMSCYGLSGVRNINK